MSWESIDHTITPWENSLAAYMPPWAAAMIWALLAGLAGALLLWGAQVLLRWLAPRVSAVQETTAREAYSQLLFYIVLAVGLVALTVSVLLSYYTFGEDLKVHKTNSLMLITMLGAFLAVMVASVSVADEIEGRTALSVLSKPIGRLRFVLGKYLGVLTPVLVLLLALSTWFLGTVAYKTGYDARENTRDPPTVQECRHEMALVVPGLGLAILQTAMLASVSVALSTRLPMLPNLLLTLGVFLVGRFVPALAQSALAQDYATIVSFVAQLIGTVLPVLQHFDSETAIVRGQAVSLLYLASSAAYAVLYCGFALLVALFLFEDRDLA
jgi:ABC-type transport system involved in multi-copper enzyme maturation permease subunit